MARADIHVLSRILKSGGKIVPHRVYKDSEVLRWGHRVVAWSTPERGWILLNTPDALRVYERFQRRERHRVNKSWDDYAARTMRDPAVSKGDVFDNFGEVWIVEKIKKRSVVLFLEERDAFGKTSRRHQEVPLSHLGHYRKVSKEEADRLRVRSARHSQQRSRKRRSARDDAPDTKRLDEAPVTKRSSSWPPETSSSRPPRGGLLSGRATYAREVLGLLRSGHGLSGTQSIRLIGKWNVLVDRAWRAGKTPCSTADHMVKYENAQICPCASSGRDCARCTTRKKGRR